MCSFVAGTAGAGMVDWGKKGNPFLEAVKAISITGEGQGLSPEEQELDRMRGEKVADRWEDDPRHPRNARKDMQELVTLPDGDKVPRWLAEGDDCASENREGSFEALLRGWGGENRKAFDNDLVR